MTQHFVRYHPQSKDDILEISDWYADQKRGLEEEFLKCLEEALAKIEANPLHCAIRYRSSRVKVLDRFPYRIIYKLIDKDIVIFGVFHAKRNPKLIRKRLK
ncbi:MAG: type II toxin-antitoxin system RelE/ParE family toxin [Bacteroidota bacterium]